MNSLICQNCFTLHKSSTHICLQCWVVVYTPYIIERENHMNIFSEFFLQKYVNSDTRKPISLHKSMPEKRKVTYNFWVNQFSVYWLVLLPVHFVIHPLWMITVLIVHLSRPYMLWTARFDEYGWITYIEDNLWNPQYNILEDYSRNNKQYALFFEKHIANSHAYIHWKHKNQENRPFSFFLGYIFGYILVGTFLGVWLYIFDTYIISVL